MCEEFYGTLLTEKQILQLDHDDINDDDFLEELVSYKYIRNIDGVPDRTFTISRVKIDGKESTGYVYSIGVRIIRENIETYPHKEIMDLKPKFERKIELIENEGIKTLFSKNVGYHQITLVNKKKKTYIISGISRNLY